MPAMPAPSTRSRSSSGDLSSLAHADGFVTPPEVDAAVDAPPESEVPPGAAASAPPAADGRRPRTASTMPLPVDDSRVDDSLSQGAPANETMMVRNESFASPATEQSSYQYGLDGLADDADALSDDDSDAPETSLRPNYIPTKPLRLSQVQISDGECLADLAEVHEVLSMFLNSRMLEAEEKCIVNASTRLYKAMGMSLINFFKALMTFEPDDIETAIHCGKHSLAVASLLRKKQGVGKFIQNKKSFYRSMTLVQLHAELGFAEDTLLVNVLRIIRVGGGIGLVKHALGLRSAYLLLRDLFRLIEEQDAQAESSNITGKKATRPFLELDQHFRSGVFFGYASCSLVLSFLPGRAHKVLEGLGYFGDRQFALQVLQRAGGWRKNKPLPSVSAEEEGTRRSLCDVLLICYHVVLPTYVPIIVDLQLADQVLQWNLQRFPHGIFFLYFQARLYAAQALPEKSIEYLRNSIEAQRSFKQLDHISFVDLALTYLSTCDFTRAYECFDVLSRESNWSRAIYQYARAVCLLESGMGDEAQSATIMRTVASLKRKVAGTTIPLEHFVTERAKLFVAQKNRLPLPGLEFSYLWHCISQTPVFLLVENTLTRIDEFIDDLERYLDVSAYGTGENEYWSAYCLSFFLRGTALRYVTFPDERTIVRAPPEEAIGSQEEVAQDALFSFYKVIQQGHRLDRCNNWLVYFAHYELGRLLECMGDRAGAMHEFDLVLCGRPLEQYGRAYNQPREAGYMSMRKPTTGHAHYLLYNMCMLRTRASVDMLHIRQTRPSSKPYQARFMMRQSSGSTGSYSVGGQTSTSAKSSFFAAAAPGTNLSDVVGHSTASFQAPSSHEVRRSSFVPASVAGAPRLSVPSPPSNASTSATPSDYARPRQRSGVPTSRMRSMRL